MDGKPLSPSGDLSAPVGSALVLRRGWLLDLDGTLIDSSPGVILAFHAAQRAFGERPADPDDICRRIGYPLADTVRDLSNVEYGPFIEVFRSEALATMHLHSRILPGALELLSWLSTRKLCAVVTSKRRDIAERILQHKGLSGFLQAIVGSDCAPEVKPHPAPLFEAARQISVGLDQLVMVGDTRNDIRAARLAGIPAIALASGHDERSLLTEADLIFDDASSLLSYLQQSERSAVTSRVRPLLFSKHDCPLCDELKDRLRRRKIHFEEKDIRSRSDWFDRYRERVPVVLLPDGQECGPPFTETLLDSWSELYG